MRVQTAGAVLAVLLVSGCGATDEGSSFPRTIGNYCAANVHSTVTQDGPTDWTITVYYNHTFDQIVTDNDGVLRTQTVRECKTGTVVVTDAPPSWTSTNALAYAAQTLGVTPL